MKSIENLRNSKAAINTAGIISIIMAVLMIFNINTYFSFTYNLPVLSLIAFYISMGIILFTKRFSLIKYAAIFYLYIILLNVFLYKNYVGFIFQVIFWLGIILTSNIKEFKKYSIYLLICPVILFLIELFSSYVSIFDIIYDDITILFVLFFDVLYICVALFFYIMICLLIGLKDNQIKETHKESKKNESEEYCNMLAFILLMLFTFGIYNLCWIYKVTRLTNQCKTEEYRNPTNKLLLCMFIPFYIIYWTYQTAKRIDKLCNSDIATLSLMFAIFIPFIPPIIIQSTMNGGFKNVKENKSSNNKTDIEDSLSIAESLKKYKELLDSGAINEKEYEDIKKKLLKEYNS